MFNNRLDRILYIQQVLVQGGVLNKQQTADRFGVSEKTIQRDLDTLRNHFADSEPRREILYNSAKGGYLLDDTLSRFLTSSEILAVCKILLESRAFTKKDMSAILDKLISGCVPQKNMKLVSDLLANEKFHYVELTNPVGIQDKLWDIGSDIQQRHLLEISYQKQGADAGSAVIRIVEPVSILFSEYYFYLNAYIVEATDGKYTHKYDYPAIFRVDRIADYRLLDQTFSLPYANRFQEGEFRKRVQFMYGGKLQKIRFKYTGPSIEAVLDRLPTAEILSQDDSGWTISAEVFGKGIEMWMRSQGDYLHLA
mgnify:CR=1 FL=1